MLCPAGFWGACKQKAPEKPKEALLEEEPSLWRTEGLIRGGGCYVGGGRGTPPCAYFVEWLDIFPPLLQESRGGQSMALAQESCMAIACRGPQHLHGSQGGFRHPGAGQSRGLALPGLPSSHHQYVKPQLDAHMTYKLQELTFAPNNTSQHHSLQIPTSSLLKHIFIACKVN